MAVVDIAGGFRVSRPAVSRHLRILHAAALVRVERRGRRRLYALDAAPLEAIDLWLAFYRQFWTARLVDLKSLAESIHREEQKGD